MRSQMPDRSHRQPARGDRAAHVRCSGATGSSAARTRASKPEAPSGSTRSLVSSSSAAVHQRCSCRADRSASSRPVPVTVSVPTRTRKKESTPKNGCSPAYQMPASSAMTGPSAAAGIRSPVSSPAPGSRPRAATPRGEPRAGVNQVRPPAVAVPRPPNSSSRPAPFTTKHRAVGRNRGVGVSPGRAGAVTRYRHRTCRNIADGACIIRATWCETGQMTLTASALGQWAHDLHLGATTYVSGCACLPRWRPAAAPATISPRPESWSGSAPRWAGGITRRAGTQRAPPGHRRARQARPSRLAWTAARSPRRSRWPCLRPAGVQRAFGTDAQSLQVGFAVDDGIRAARLAAAGATADLTALDAWLALVGGDAAALDLTGPAVPGGLAIKMYPCCDALQRPISALAELAEETGIEAAEVQRVELRTPESTVVPLIHHRPETGLQGKFSLEYAAAAALLDSYPGLTSFTDQAVRRSIPTGRTGAGTTQPRCCAGSCRPGEECARAQHASAGRRLGGFARAGGRRAVRHPSARRSRRPCHQGRAGRCR